MAEELHLKATVQSGGRVEIVCPKLEAGQAVEVTVRPVPAPAKGQSVYEIISNAPGQLLFKTAKDVDSYIREERESWDR
jgi:hypothetical protein